MLKTAAKNVATAALLLVVVSLAVFVLLDISPSDPARRIAGDEASPEAVAEVRARLGLDRPLVERYLTWAGNAIQGDFGSSVITRQEVSSALGRTIPVSASLVVVAMTISLIVGVAVGVIGAARPDSLIDRGLMVLSSIALAVPSFIVGLVLVIVFALKADWLPAVGYQPLSSGIWQWLQHLILPALALAAVAGAELARQVRASLTEALDTRYVLAAHARGIPRVRLLLAHALKNAAGPVLTVMGFRVAQLIGGTIFVERVFGLRGLGSLATDAALQGDYPIILGVTVTALVTVVIVNLVVDVGYGVVNPRVRVK